MQVRVAAEAGRRRGESHVTRVMTEEFDVAAEQGNAVEAPDGASHGDLEQRRADEDRDLLDVEAENPSEGGVNEAVAEDDQRSDGPEDEERSGDGAEEMDERGQENRDDEQFGPDAEARRLGGLGRRRFTRCNGEVDSEVRWFGGLGRRRFARGNEILLAQGTEAGVGWGDGPADGALHWA